MKGAGMKGAGMKDDGDSFNPATSIGYLISVATSLAQGSVERRMAAHELTCMQWKPLYALWSGRAGTAAEIATYLRVDAGAVTRMLDRLEMKDLIRRSRDEKDRRVVRLELTTTGRVVAACIPTALREVNDELAAGLTDRQRKELACLLQRVIENLQNKDRE